MVLGSRVRPVMTYSCLCKGTACKYSDSVPVYLWASDWSESSAAAKSACGYQCVTQTYCSAGQPGPAAESLWSCCFKFQVGTMNVNLMVSLLTRLGLKHFCSCCGRAAADVLLVLWRCCWPGGYAAGPANVVLAQRIMCGGHDELECAARPVDVLLALRGRAAVPGQSPAGQWENSKAVTLKSSLTQNRQPAEGPSKTLWDLK